MCNFLAIDDFSTIELESLLRLASKLKQEHFTAGNKPALFGKTLAMIFQKPSLRTRVSFEVAMHHLGGKSIYIAPQDIEIGKREPVPDIARVLDGFVDAIMARVFQHEHILELAKHTSIPVINGLSDYNHPCQALGDMLTIMEQRSKLQELRLTFIGDGNNVATSLSLICALMGIHFTIASPKGYELKDDVVKRVNNISTNGRVGFVQMTDPIAAVSNADIIYTDIWTSMGQEQETKHRQKIFQKYQVNQDLVSKAKPNVIVMHDLPAKRGQEITNEVVDGPNSVIFQQAHNRMHSAKAILYTLLSG
jgi:ornithine carbamoyltransferase